MKTTDVKTCILKDGRSLGYSEYGDIHGAPLFYFHGWPTSRLQAAGWAKNARELHIRLISVDRPGYGCSDYQKNRKLLDWPKDISELADRLKITRFSVVGVSGGGPYAAACAYQLPDRLKTTGIVVGLAPTYIPGLLDGMPFLTRYGWENYPRYTLLRKGAALLHYVNARWGPSFGLHRFMFGAKKDRLEFADPQLRIQVNRAYREAFRHGYKGVEQDLNIYTSSWGFDLRKITVPVVLFYGEADQNVPLAMGMYYRKLIKNSRLFSYPGEGHLISRTHQNDILRIFIGD